MQIDLRRTHVAMAEIRRKVWKCSHDVALGFFQLLQDVYKRQPLAMPQAGLAHQLGAVGPLGADVLLLHFKNFPMYEAMDGAASGPAYPCLLYTSKEVPVSVLLVELPCHIGVRSFRVFPQYEAALVVKQDRAANHIALSLIHI